MGYDLAAFKGNQEYLSALQRGADAVIDFFSELGDGLLGSGNARRRPTGVAGQANIQRTAISVGKGAYIGNDGI